ncbi:MAG TPA: hypothetical protein ENN40_06415 [Candidatus Aminicenantes bacterium]|nr:hypothetical protein [Candidatus Aminicenantes bacterium]
MKKKMAILMMMVPLLGAFLQAEKVAELVEVARPQAIEWANGNMYILDGTTMYIYDDASYAYKGKFGKRGEGPGELMAQPFGGPILMLPMKNKIIVSSMGKLSTYSPDGVFLKERKINAFDAFYPFGDHYLCMTVHTREDQAQVLAIYLADENLRKGEKPIIISKVEVGQNASFLFPFTAFFPIPYRDKLYIAPDPDNFAIGVYDKDGEKINTLRLDYTPVKIDPEYRKKTEKWFRNDANWKNIYDFFKDRISYRKYYPPVHFIIAESDRLYISTHRFNNRGWRECIILTLKGKEIKRVFLPIPETYGMDFTAPFNFHDRCFYTLVDNSDDEIWELHKISLD